MTWASNRAARRKRSRQARSTRRKPIQAAKWRERHSHQRRTRPGEGQFLPDGGEAHGDDNADNDKDDNDSDDSERFPHSLYPGA